MADTTVTGATAAATSSQGTPTAPLTAATPAATAPNKQGFAAKFGEGCLHLVEDIGKGVLYLPTLLAKWKKVASAAQSEESAFVQAGEPLLADITDLLAKIGAASIQKGLNWTEDQAAVQAVEKLVADAPAFINAIKAGAAAIKAAL